MRILIAGLAKTGTTGLLYLIANSFGEKIKLLFEPLVCPSAVEAANDDLAAKIIIKSVVDWKSFSHFDKKIIIVRDPRDRMISSLLYSQYHADYLFDDKSVLVVRECLERKEACPSGVSIREIYENLGKVKGNSMTVSNYLHGMRNSLELFNNFVETMPEVFLYKYEDFVSGVYQPLEKYLARQLSGIAKVPENFKRVERTLSFGDWRNWFTEEDVRHLRPIISPWLKTYGYDSEDWKLNDEPTINPAHCSEYFMRLVEEYRERTFLEKQQSALTVTEKAIPRELEPSDSVQSLGHLDQSDEGFCKGWAFNAKHPTTAAKVQIFVNNRLVLTTEAGLLRPDIKKHGIHPTGLCGFRFEWPPAVKPQAGDWVDARIEGDTKALNGSPKQMSATKAECALQGGVTGGASLSIARPGPDDRTRPVPRNASHSAVAPVSHLKPRAGSDRQTRATTLSGSLAPGRGQGALARRGPPVNRDRIGVAELIEKVNPDLLGQSAKEAAVLIHAALSLLGRHIAALDKGVVKVDGLGSFRVGFVGRDKERPNNTGINIMFRATEPKNKYDK